MRARDFGNGGMSAEKSLRTGHLGREARQTAGAHASLVPVDSRCAQSLYDGVYVFRNGDGVLIDMGKLLFLHRTRLPHGPATRLMAAAAGPGADRDTERYPMVLRRGLRRPRKQVLFR